jgi:hypothetical protein
VALVLACVASAVVGLDSAAGAVPRASGLANGVGTKDALNSPTCDSSTGRLAWPYPIRPPCVKTWTAGANNGGATAPGVTSGAIKVVVLTPTDAQVSQQNGFGVGPKNRATGAAGTYQDAFTDTKAIFDKMYQTWGRQIQFTYVKSSGNDEASQHADAISIAAEKPFAAIITFGTGGTVLSADLAQRKILVIGAGTHDEALKNPGYIWNIVEDPNATAALAAEFLGKSVAGQPAKWAGDAALKTEKRKIGAIYDPNTLDINLFNQELKKAGGGTLALAQQYTPPPGTGPVATPASTAASQDAAPTIAAKFKDAGITTVITWSDSTMITALTQAATSQNYHPEWFIPSNQAAAFDFTARGFDQDQWSHAFGVVGLPPAVEGTSSDATSLSFDWYWGPTKGTYQAFALGEFSVLYSGIQMAGPKLTVKTFQQGMFSIPAYGGAASGEYESFMTAWGPKAKLPWNQYFSSSSDLPLGWWDATVTGPSNIIPITGKGKWVYLNGAKRYSAGTFPKGEQPFFDASSSLVTFKSYPDKIPSYPCNGCPSSSAGG